MDDVDEVASGAARVREPLETDIATAQREFMELVEPGETTRMGSPCPATLASSAATRL
ncbi:hypothetical protein AB0B12_40295 [Streptomyces sp. NPDC044780]|uniref:hypothetical protein n=1 Tax=unclassified Streptomyces TaxID=2593676 RepID=UPI00340FBDD4